MEEARDWARLFIGEIKAGRDPGVKPTRKEPTADLQHVAGFLDAYFEQHLKPAGIRSLNTAAGRLKMLKQYFGDDAWARERPTDAVLPERNGRGTAEGTRNQLKRRTLKAVVGGHHG
jgi:hypothetical protein